MPSFGVNIPFVELLGFQLTRLEDGESEIEYDPRPEHTNSFGVVHGGATMTLHDVSLATAARSVEQQMGVVTIECKTTFMQPARGRLTAKGRLIHRTATMAFTESTIYDAAGRACSQATGTFKYVPRLPVGAKSTQKLDVIRTD